jgi:hypothetical protein
LPDTAEFVEAAEGATAGEPIPDEIFVRAIDLPTLSVRQARAAVAQQIDILSPLPPAEVASCVVLVGPVEEGLNRFAVGFAPKGLLTRVAAPSERTVTLTGWLDGEAIAFRFDRPGAAPVKPDWRAGLEATTIAGACLAILLAAASLRLDHEIDRAQSRLDAANARVQRLSRETAALDRIGGAWRAAQVTRRGAVVDCALAGLAKAAGGPVTLSKLTLANGQISARLSAPISDSTLTALRALGFSAASTELAPATAPAPAAAAAIQDVRTSAADCR